MHIFQFNHYRQYSLDHPNRNRETRKPAFVLPLIFYGLFLFTGFFLSVSQASQQSQTSTIEQSVNWLVLGDSLSAAYGIDSEKGWVSLLQQQVPDKNIVNASISGETTSGGKQRFKVLLQQHQPEVMIIELGANDALRGQDLNTTKANLEQIIQGCLSAEFSCQPVLLGIRLPTNYGPAYDQFLQSIYQQLADQYQLPFDPFFIEEVATDPDMMQWDGLHPNEDAQPLIAERVYQLIKPLLGQSPINNVENHSDSTARLK